MEFLSKRGSVMLARQGRSKLSKYYYQVLRSETYSEANPEGLINLGVAENFLCEQLIVDKINTDCRTTLEPNMLHYCDFAGDKTATEVVARFVTKFFETAETISGDHITINTCCTAVVDQITYMLCNENEYALLPTPSYYGFDVDGKFFEGLPAPCESGAGRFDITAEAIEIAFKRHVSQGKKIKMVLLITPNNPTGEVLSERTLLDILTFCRRKNLWLIVDEIYALSAFRGKFTSCLSLPQFLAYDKLIWFYSISKDFGYPALRSAIVWCKNATVTSILRAHGYSGLGMGTAALKTMTTLLNDHDWISESYLPICKARLQSSADYVVQRLARIGVKCIKPDAGVFVLADFGQYLGSQSEEAEWKLFETLFNELKIYTVPGPAMYCPQRGWFRITHAHSQQLLSVAMDRLEEFLNRANRNF